MAWRGGEKVDVGIEAENIVIDFFNKEFPGQISVRPATKEEDSGLKHAPESKQIDAVVYDSVGTPVMCVQITTARDSTVRMKKMLQLVEKPFIRLSEMSPKDKAIPKVLIYVDPSEIEEFLNDHDFLTHPKIAEQILMSSVSSLEFVATKTKNSGEKERINWLVKTLKNKKNRIH